MKITDNTHRTSLLAIVLLSVIGSIFIAWYTRKGPWGWSDSVAYLVSARNIIRGIGVGYYFPNGYFYILNIQAPLYSIILALIGLLRGNLITDANILNIFLFGGTIFFAGFSFYRYSDYPLLSVVACLVVGLFPVLIQSYTEVMTEGLFFFLYFLSLFLLLGYLKSKRISWMIACGVVTGLLPVTRYIGAVFIVTSILSIYLFLDEPWRSRFKNSLLFGLVGIIPLSAWGLYLLHTKSIAAKVTTGGLSWPQVISRISVLRAATIQLIWKWLPLQEYFPIPRYRDQYLTVLFLVIAFTLITTLAAKKCKNDFRLHSGFQGYILYIVFGMSALLLSAFIVLSYVFFGLPGRMDDRQLLPVFITSVLSLVSGIAIWFLAWIKPARSWIKVIGWGAVLLLLFWCYPQYLKSSLFIYLNHGLMDSSWADSETVRAIRQMPPTTIVVSNDAAALLFWADHPAYDVIQNLSPEFVNEITPYGSDKSDRAQMAFNESDALLVIFNDFPGQMVGTFHDPGIKRLSTIFSGLVVDKQYSDGTIYTAAQATTP